MNFNTLAITLSSGEAEFNDCKNSVVKQKGTNVTHLVFEGLSEIEAHNSLLDVFEKEKKNFDLFVKVDADTIIDYDNAFDIVHSKIKSTNAAAAQLYLYDYFTCKNINGLNFFNPCKNKFYKTDDPLFCDRSIVHEGMVLNSSFFTEDKIVPIGRHCAYPTDKQSFHYGFHRGLKKRNEEYRSTLRSYNLYKDRARMIACKGFEFSKKFPNFSHDYSSEQFKQMFLDFMDSLN